MTTPARKQYLDIKNHHKDEILLFRMGDFYETFDDDAKLVSEKLEIALTSKEMGKGEKVPLAGIPFHSLEAYLPKLIDSGHNVAICEQVSDPSKSKGIVDREVVRIVTPGTITEDSLLQESSNNYLASAVIKGKMAGLSFIDISTSEFFTTEIPKEKLFSEIDRFAPRELIIPETLDCTIPSHAFIKTTSTPDNAFHPKWSVETLKNHFKVRTMEPYGCETMPLACQAAGAIIDYVTKNNKGALSSITSLQTYSTASFMILDEQTRRNLELFSGGRWDSKTASLFSILDKTNTPMGTRMLRKWVGQPLLDLSILSNRQDSIEWFIKNPEAREYTRSILRGVSDIERLITRVTNNTATPRDLLGIRESLQVCPHLISKLSENMDKPLHDWLLKGITDYSEPLQLLEVSIADDPPSILSKDKSIRDGFSKQLDLLRENLKVARLHISDMESEERNRTKIKSLKVGFNKVFGYYFEVSKSNLHLVPSEYIRKQTLVNGERYINGELKEYEDIILTSQSKIETLENDLFNQICQQLRLYSSDLLSFARCISTIDAINALSIVANENNYVRPILNHNSRIQITSGRHPVIENMVVPGTFITNETVLDNDDCQIMLLTGPNMSGKSTYLRQVAIIVLMAQIGSYVPADYAEIGLVDRIYTRVGLQDDLTVGQSTFMVEMVETAYILNQATSKSLIILDEIGRGTSTYDGLAIAQSVAEFLHNHPSLGCKTLFATHYHEMTTLAETFPRIRNYHVAVSEENGEVIFLRQVMEGDANKSYGIHVARLAGIPGPVISRAWDLLMELESSTKSEVVHKSTNPEGIQLPMLEPNMDISNEIKNLDIVSLTPIEAITKLYELQMKIKGNHD